MSKRIWFWVLAVPVLVCTAELSFITGWKVAAPRVERVADISNLYEASFLVRTEDSSGSGTVFRDSHGELLILTAAHVVEGTKHVLLRQSVVLCGERLAGVSIDGDVIEVDETLDLALIRPRSAKAFSEWCRHVAVIYKGNGVPDVGTAVVHVGSRLGEIGERSISFGTISGIARKMESDNARLDQHTAPASPGSSGGGIFDAHTGELIGVLTRGISDTFSFYVPARDINQFLKNTLH